MITVRNVKKIYRVGQTSLAALNGADLTIEEGEFCCIVGRSGSGKSTLLNLMAGLEKPSGGEIIIASQHIEKMNESELIMFRQRNVGFVFQSFNLLPSMTAIENVSLALTFRAVPREIRNKRAQAMLDAVGIGTHAKHKPTQMSGGQQQRVGLARAMVSNPKILFADEPTGNLDSKTSDEIMQLISNIVHKKKQTFVMVTHDPLMAKYADKVVHILDGKITRIDINPRKEEQHEQIS